MSIQVFYTFYRHNISYKLLFKIKTRPLHGVYVKIQKYAVKNRGRPLHGVEHYTGIYGILFTLHNLGASSLGQLKVNLDLSDKPPLEKSVVQYFDNWWQMTKNLCPKYFR